MVNDVGIVPGRTGGGGAENQDCAIGGCIGTLYLAVLNRVIRGIIDKADGRGAVSGGTCINDDQTDAAACCINLSIDSHIICTVEVDERAIGNIPADR